MICSLQRTNSVEFAILERHELLGEEFAAVFLDDTAAFPTETITVTGEEGIDLIGHVFLKFVLGGCFDPGGFSFLNTETVDR